MTRETLVALALVVAQQACQSAEPYNRDAKVLKVTVVDSVRDRAWWSVNDSMFTYLFEVRTTVAVDTVLGVIEPLPTSSGDTLVIGLAVDTATHGRMIFIYDVRRRRTEHEALPSDAWGGLRDFSISPDGEHLLYITWVSGPVGEVAIVRHRRSGEIVLRGPRWSLCECDSDVHHARWVTADSFEIATGAIDAPGLERLSGSLSRGSVHTDTVSADHKWH